MQHGTLLIHTDMTRLSQYLSPSADKLKAKGVASVRSRVCNLQDACKDIEPARLCEELLIAFEQEYAPVQARLVDTALDKADYQDLIDKYSSWEWIIGQTPAFQANYETRFAWGEVQLCFDVLHGAIQSARVFSDAMDADLIRSIEEKLPGVRADRESLAVAAGSVGGERAQEAASWIRTLNI